MKDAASCPSRWRLPAYSALLAFRQIGDPRLLTTPDSRLRIWPSRVRGIGSFKVGHHSVSLESTKIVWDKAAHKYAADFEASRRKRNTIDYPFSNVAPRRK